MTDIPTKVKKVVHQRDSECCIKCGIYVTWNYACAHIVPRTSGGLGIEQNIVTLCSDCHYLYDKTESRSMLYDYFVEYLTGIYPDWEREKMIFKKGQNGHE